MRNVVWSYCGTVLIFGLSINCGGRRGEDLFSAPPEDSSPAGATLPGAGGTLIATEAGDGAAGTTLAGEDAAGGRGGRSSGEGSGDAGTGTSAVRGGAPTSSGGRAPTSFCAGQGGHSGDGGAETSGGTAGQAGAAGAGGSGAVQTAGSAGLDAGTGGASGGAPGTCEPTAEVCDGVDNDCNGATDENNRCPAGCSGFSLGADYGYMYCSNGLTHAQATQRCERQGMHLVNIQSAAKNAAVLDAIFSVAAGAPPSSVHIGATHTAEGTWSWVDGTIFWTNGSPVDGAYVNWDRGEPNGSLVEGGEDCGTMLVAALASDAGLWNDVPCSTPFAFVCEAE
jgi:hypothetical protein